jgi:RpiB/LacA/LacB family sugar-phosphate isomerase
MESQLVVIGSDHAGFWLKEEIRRHLDHREIAWVDMGPGKLNTKDDYPDYAKRVAELVVRKKAKGILVCSTGFGMAMAANKVKGARAVSVESIEGARLARRHNDANILCLGSRFLKQTTSKKIMDVFLNEKFEGGRHLRRLNKIRRLERAR